MHGGQHCLGYWDIGFNFAWALPGYGILKLLFYFVVDESIAVVSTYSHRSYTVSTKFELFSKYLRMDTLLAQTHKNYRIYL